MDKLTGPGRISHRLHVTMEIKGNQRQVKGVGKGSEGGGEELDKQTGLVTYHTDFT